MSFMKFKFLSTFVCWVVLLWKGFGILSCDFSASVNMIIFYFYFIKFCIQFSSVTQSYLSVCDCIAYSTPGFPVHHQLLELAQTHVHWVSDAIQPSHPLSSPSPPTFNLSQHQGLSNESILWIRWPKFWGFSVSISPSNEYSGLISFRMDWLDLLSVQGTLKNLLQHHSSKASVLWCSTFFVVQLSHPYMTTGKTIAFTRQTLVGKVMSLLFDCTGSLLQHEGSVALQHVGS